MKPWHIRFISYLILAVLCATLSFAFQGPILKICTRLDKDNSGLAEIQSIAEKNKILPSDIVFALQMKDPASFPLLLYGQLFYFGYVLASFGLVNALVSRILKTKNKGLAALISYGFWIRLIGVFTFLSSVNFFYQRAMELAGKHQFELGAFWMVRYGQELLAAIVALLIIWKADWIAEILGRLGSSNKVPERTSAPGASEVQH
ncbi:MAG: hypothetical protein PHW60_15855 [Kiritimatiellae bacterium]|nr:hypothetical protein [Kiritimatiellia bacterium]